ncbi:serine carboxypeptidase-like 40 [Senna tora]|uniref:Carboxypeptidase n=1 Tax=Senna tora TaxID=362788 RepID=A0A834TN71_9FABA|nr:serine carboxypeptidase-like 40 [Senna tora]
MQELGPFRVNSDGKTLYNNKYSWSYAANVLFLESPAGVGFSYSNRSSDYGNSGDRKTAADNYVFLVNWLKRFGEYKKREFYIAGESYAGHYVPQLAHTILFHNKKANRTIINLKGILIGNAVINDETDTKGMYDFLSSHAIISDKAAHDMYKLCDQVFSNEANANDNVTNECNAATDEIEKDLGFIDVYNIYAPLCHNSNLTSIPKTTSVVNDPCGDFYVYAYLNRGEVQEALHANVTKLTHDWEPCSDVITKWGDSPSSIIPLLQQFLQNGLRVWIFSGDIDGRVPVTSTKYSIEKMNLPVKSVWRPWFLHGELHTILRAKLGKGIRTMIDFVKDVLEGDGFKAATQGFDIADNDPQLMSGIITFGDQINCFQTVRINFNFQESFINRKTQPLLDSRQSRVSQRAAISIQLDHTTLWLNPLNSNDISDGSLITSKSFPGGLNIEFDFLVKFEKIWWLQTAFPSKATFELLAFRTPKPPAVLSMVTVSHFTSAPLVVLQIKDFDSVSFPPYESLGPLLEQELPLAPFLALSPS